MVVHTSCTYRLGSYGGHHAAVYRSMYMYQTQREHRDGHRRAARPVAAMYRYTTLYRYRCRCRYDKNERVPCWLRGLGGPQGLSFFPHASNVHVKLDHRQDMVGGIVTGSRTDFC